MKNIVKKPLLYVRLVISSLMALAFVVSTLGSYYNQSNYGSSGVFQVQSHTDTADYCNRCQELCSTK